MRIFRVENSKGQGPYRVKGTRAYRLSQKHADVTHPIPPIEWRQKLLHQEVFGFASLNQAFNWFDWEDCTSLGRARYYLSEYEVDDTFVTLFDKQCAFYHTQAKLIRRVPIARALKDFLEE